jgi:alpha-L-fucosidase
MKMTRRTAVGLLAGGVTGVTAKQTGSAVTHFDIAPGPFVGTRESLESYQAPAWFRDAKFGIWAHWGPQSAAEAGDWYARNMYMQGSRQYNYHVEHYGHPSKFGFKDIIPTWTASEFDPEYLVGLYKKAGARYFVSMGVHHDNFDLWDSKYTRWNAANMGPKKNIAGMFRTAALRHGLKFGMSEHLWITYKWFSTSHDSDKTGPLAGVAYDGVKRANWDLYTDDQTVYRELPWNADGIPERWKQHWYRRIKDLIDQNQPDLLYTDGPLPFEGYGLNIVAHLYNSSAARNGGTAGAVYNSKRPEDCAKGTCVLDVERGIVDQIWPQPWQTDTSVGDWHYRRDDTYKTPKAIVDMLVDVVSRNGNLLLNFPLPNNGRLNPTELNILAEIAEWMSVNSDGIYGTRPWTKFGEGPAATAATGADAKFNESKRKELTSEDVRFTTKGEVLYAFVMGVPARRAVVRSLAAGDGGDARRVQGVQLLGAGRVEWKQDGTGLIVELPEKKPSKYALALKVAF